MNWISALSPLQWALMLIIPPAVLSLYFLKLKRKEIDVSSTLLWKRTVEDLHVNSIWQKLRKNLLLYLQLLFLGLLIFACLRPGWSGQSRVGERRIYIIDNSASMQATDVAPSRLELAKKKAKELISDAAGDDVGMVIAFSDRADVRQGFTKDRNRLLQSIDSIKPTMHATDVSEALRAAAGLANPGRSSFDDLTDIAVADAVPATVYLLSDGGFGDLGDIELGQLNMEYVAIGESSAENVGIINFSVQRSDDKNQQLEVFAKIVNHGTSKVALNASLELDGQLLDASAVEIESGQETGVVFELSEVDSGILKLELDHRDSFEGDNTAYAAIRPTQPIQVLLVTPGNSALETALRTDRVSRIASLQVESPSILLDDKFAEPSSESRYDLIVFDQCTPSKMPSCNTMFVGAIPPKDIWPNSSEGVVTDKDRWRFGELQGPVVVLDVNRANAITQYLEMGSVSIVEARTVLPPESGDILMVGDIGPIFSVAPRGPFQDAVLGFPIVQTSSQGTLVNTDWGIKRSFPVFAYSAVEFLGGGITESSAPSVQPGWPIGLQLSSRMTDFQIQTPLGEKVDLSRGEESRVVFTRTDIPGAYQVFADNLERPIETFCVNLFSSRESNLAVADSVRMGFEKVAASGSSIQARKEIWRWILLVGLALLFLEWIVFNRRVFI
jgi:hypothetical protein